MKIILYCAPEAIEPLTRVIKAADHIVVATHSDSLNLIYSIAKHTPHALVSDVGHLASRPQVLAEVLHLFPGLSTFLSYQEKEGWEHRLREFLSRPRLPEKPRRYAESERTIYHDGALQAMTSGKLRRPDYAAEDSPAKCLREASRFVLQLQAGRVNHAAALHYYRCLKAQQRGLDLEIGYRLVHGSHKALAWSLALASRWLGLLSHYIHGAELDYLPAPMTPGPAVDFVHHGPTVEALYAFAQVIRFGVVIPIASEIKFLVGVKFDRQPETELFQLSIRVYGFAQFLQRVGEAQISLMSLWLNPDWDKEETNRTYKRHLATYRDFWCLPYLLYSPESLRAVLAGFHRGKTRVVIPGISRTEPTEN
jgi:hypothetical protein